MKSTFVPILIKSFFWSFMTDWHAEGLEWIKSTSVDSLVSVQHSFKQLLLFIVSTTYDLSCVVQRLPWKYNFSHLDPGCLNVLLLHVGRRFKLYQWLGWNILCLDCVAGAWRCDVLLSTDPMLFMTFLFRLKPGSLEEFLGWVWRTCQKR